MIPLPTTNFLVDKYTPSFKNNVQTTTSTISGSHNNAPTLLQIIKESPYLKANNLFENIIHLAGMEPLLNDPQANMTIFIPTELHLPKGVIESCVYNPLSTIESVDVLTLNFEDARRIVNSVIIPNILTTTMMIQSAYTLYKTRDPINRLFVETRHCVQFEPYTFNKPPFGIVLNNKSKIVIPDIVASNGIIHIVDKHPNFF